MIGLEGVAKRYGETVALHGIDVTMSAGHVHTILGENGSGKSTLVKLLSGIVRPDRGSIRVDGQPVDLSEPAVAHRHGIATVFQEVLLAPSRTVLDNIFLGYDGPWTYRLPLHRRREVAEAVLARFARNMPDLTARGGEVPLAQQQLVVLARALVRDPRILILDEVTAALDVADRDVLFDALRGFVAEGRLVVFISHRLDEVRRLSDRVTVLRSGRAVETLEGPEVTSERLLQLMIPDAHLRVHATDA
ncbi:MAG: ATP-binding cassette domain-containing protein [Geminicoccaceae bacterium]